MAIDLAYDYNSNALYMLSIDKNNKKDANNAGDDDSNNNLVHADTINYSNSNNTNGVIWKISYQGEGEEVPPSSNDTALDGNSSSDDNSTSSSDDNSTS